MTGIPDGRLDSLDLIRGVAVLGILAINIGGFAGPSLATLSPHLPFAGTQADEIAFAIRFLLFEGKMRALFSLLFGASLMLMIMRAKSAGQFGQGMQARRLGWLALFGLAHFYLLWWGDILFIYALAGMIALMLAPVRSRTLLALAGAVFVLWHAAGAALAAPDVAREDRVLAGKAGPAEQRTFTEYRAQMRDHAAQETRQVSGTFAAQASSRISGQTLHPLAAAVDGMGETLPLMLLGMVLQRSGFFAGQWRRRVLATGAAGGIGIGGLFTGAILGYVWPHGFPPAAIEAALLYWTAIPHVLMALGYVALLVLVAPRLARTSPGQWLTAAGRMAFSNYIGTTILMTAIFYGWGFGWIGRFGEAWQWAFVLLGWAAMLLFSTGWLARFHRGPLEWIWRSLVAGSMLPNRR